jgi:hypothetical protein
LVADLYAGTPRIIGSGGRARSHTSLERELRARLPLKLAGVVRDAVRDAAATATSEVTSIQFGDTGLLAVTGIFGPHGTRHGMSVWVGSRDESPGPPPAAAGFEWDAQRRLIHLPPAPPEPFASRFTGGQATLTTPEFFRVADVEDSINLIRTLLSSEAGVEYDCIARYLRGGEAIAAIHLVVNSGSVPDGLWSGIGHDVLPPPGQWPSLESATLAALPKLAPEDTHIVLVDVAKMRLLRWVTDPVPAIMWKGTVDNRDTPHPDDVERIFAAALPVVTGEARSGTVTGIRLRHRDGGINGNPIWTVVDADGTLLNDVADDGPKIGLIRFRVVGHSNDPDPVPVDDIGHPGLD